MMRQHRLRKSRSWSKDRQKPQIGKRRLGLKASICAFAGGAALVVFLWSRLQTNGVPGPWTSTDRIKGEDQGRATTGHEIYIGLLQDPVLLGKERCGLARLSSMPITSCPAPSGHTLCLLQRQENVYVVDEGEDQHAFHQRVISELLSL